MRETMIFDTDKYQLRDYVLKRMMDIVVKQKQSQSHGTVFFGDSIVEGYPLKDFFLDNETLYNCGVAGITSDMLLHFVDEGVIKYQPKHVFILIGTNDLGNTTMTSPRQIALNVKELVEIIHYNLPDCHIDLLSCIPCIESIHGYQASHQGLRSQETLKMVFQEYQNVIAYDYVSFIDIYPALCDQSGEPKASYYTDGLHINKDGYQAITAILQETLKKRGDKTYATLL